MGAGALPTIVGYDGFAPAGLNGAASLFRVRQVQTDRWLLVEIWPVALADEAAARRFLRDVEAAGWLGSHPNVAVPVDAGVGPDGRPYVAWSGELFDGRGTTLDHALRTSGVVDVRDALRIGILLGGAVETANQAGEVHRGISPNCVFLTASGSPLLAGFGMGPVFEMGVRYFAAPEVLERRAAGPAADVYSLAAVIYAMLAGRAPHAPGLSDPPDSGPALLLRVLRNEVPPIDRADVPESLNGLLLAALMPDGAARTPTAAAFTQSLQDFQRAHRFEPTETVVLAPERADDTLTDYWPGAVPDLGPSAGAATSAVWVAPVPKAEAPPPPPPPPVADGPVEVDPTPRAPDNPSAGDAPTAAEPTTPPMAPVEPDPAPEAPTPTRGGFAPVEPDPGAAAPTPAEADARPRKPPPPLVPTSPPPRPPRSKAPLAIGALVVLSALATVAIFMLEPKDGAEPGEQTTTTRPEPNVPIPSGLTAVESPAGVQLDWVGDAEADYVVLLMSEVAAPKVLEANTGPSFLVPVAEIEPDVGYCFAVANLSTVELSDDDTTSAFSTPACIRGASETSVQGS